MMDEERIAEETARNKKEGNTCMAIGAGVGVLGVTSAALAGAVCPLCVVAAPGLIGYGAYRRWKVVEPDDKDQKPEE